MTASPDATGGLQRGTWRLTLLVVVLIAACLRLNGITRETLWLDEVYSATFAVQHPFNLIVAVWRFDVHPPLYYLQLHIWALVSKNTVWLFMNSVAWSTATVVSVFFAAKRIYGERIATGAALILAVLPSDIFYSHQLRMYAMVSCIAIWCWYAVHQAIRVGVPGRSAFYVGVAELALGYSHGSGAVDAFVFAVYGFLLAFQEVRHRIALRRWLLLQAAIGVLLLPAVVNSSVRSLSHTVAPDLQQIFETLGFLVFGLGASSSLVLRIAASALFLSILLAAMRRPPDRAIAAGLVLVPIGLLFTASHLARPIWIDRALLFITPFMAVVLSSTFAAVCDYARAWWKWRGTAVIANGMALGFLALAGFLSFSELRNYEKPTRYETAARTIAEESRPGDLVYAPSFVSFWGIAWYLLGPSWGSVLAVQDPIQQSPSTDKWPEVLRRLGPAWRERLHLEPATRSVPALEGELIIGWTFPPKLREAKRVWIVDRNPPDIAAKLMSPLVETGATDFHGIWLRRFETPALEHRQ